MLKTVGQFTSLPSPLSSVPVRGAFDYPSMFIFSLSLVYLACSHHLIIFSTYKLSSLRFHPDSAGCSTPCWSPHWAIPVRTSKADCLPSSSAWLAHRLGHESPSLLHLSSAVNFRSVGPCLLTLPSLPAVILFQGRDEVPLFLS